MTAAALHRLVSDLQADPDRPLDPTVLDQIHPSFRAKLGDVRLLETLTYWRNGLLESPTVITIRTDARNRTVGTLLGSDNYAWHLTLSLTDGLIGTLMLKEAEYQHPEASSDSPSLEVLEQWWAGRPRTSFLIRDLDSGQDLASVNKDVRMPLASTIKIMILGALARQLGPRGDWDREIPFEERHRTPGTGMTFDAPGPVSLRDAAHRMMSASDNTASTLLQDHVGRDAVEACLLDAGGDERDLPVLTSREMFALDHLLLTEPATPTVHRDLFEAAQLVSYATSYATARAQSTPTMVLNGNWLATSTTIANGWAALDQLRQADATGALAPIMVGRNRFPVDAGAWPFVGYKGGTLFGVIHDSWLAVRADGRRFAIVTAEYDEQHLVAGWPSPWTAHQALRLLASV